MVRAPDPLPADALRWSCEPARFSFETTEDVEPIEGVIGQDAALEALTFGLETSAPGQNIFVRGLAGTGRLTLVRRVIESIRSTCTLTDDRCFVRNFDEPDRPALVTVPRGTAHDFQRRVEELARCIREDLGPALSSQVVRARREVIDRRFESEIKETMAPIDEELEKRGLAMVQVQAGQTTRPMLVPRVEGRAVLPEQIDELREKGALTDEHLEGLEEHAKEVAPQLEAVTMKVAEIRARHQEALRKLYESEARAMLVQATANVRRVYGGDDVKRFLDGVVDDAVEHLAALGQGADVTERYRVHVVLGHEHDQGCPVLIENVPTVERMIGSIDRQVHDGQQGAVDHTSIRAGSLLEADGGFLIVEARDLLASPGAWAALVRTLRSGQLEISPPELPDWLRGPSLRPEPIPIRVKVVLLGDAHLYALLDRLDPDFPHLFKVLADFDSTIERDDRGLAFYAGVLARLIREHAMLAFDRGAVAALAEHGARVAASGGKLTTRFGRLADIAHEASYLARKDVAPAVTGGHVNDAVVRTKRRADLPARKFRELIADGTIRIQTRGERVGQVNGLAVVHAGQLTYGFPSRITATLGPGTRGTINIEREAQLSGAIHTKGFYILGGLLRHLLRTEHPLAFEASIAFEQTYGGIDGDSASGAEICCLLSALTGDPLRQDLAMTGAIDQVGNILPIGGVNEKIEGFFDACRDEGLTGTQGVIIPRANEGDLMLRHDVVEAAREGRFAIHAVATIEEALAIFTRCEVGERDADGEYPRDSLLGRAMTQAHRYWRMVSTVRRPYEGLTQDEATPRPDEEPVPASGESEAGDGGAADRA